MNYYEHTIIVRQDISPTQMNQIIDKYTNLIEKNDGKLIQTQKWGLLSLSYIIKKNRKGNYIHFKIEGSGELIRELEKNEKIDKNLLKYMTIKVKEFDLKTNYFLIKEKDEAPRKRHNG